MSPSHTNKKGVRYRYYVSQGLLRNRPKADRGNVLRIPAPDIEAMVETMIMDLMKAEGVIRHSPITKDMVQA